MNGGMEFDGQREINQRLERGQSYGLRKDQYGSLALASMAAFRHAGVEPCMIRPLPGGPGADVTLFGRSFQYTIRMEPLKKRSTLFALPLDSKLDGCGCELCVHEFAETDYVGPILSMILQHEGICMMDYEQATDYVREQQLKNPPKPRQIWE